MVFSKSVAKIEVEEVLEGVGVPAGDTLLPLLRHLLLGGGRRFRGFLLFILQRGLGLGADLDVELDLLALAVDGEGLHIAGVGLGNRLHQRVGVLDIKVVDLHDYVVDLDTGLLRRGSLGDVLHHRAGLDAGDAGGFIRERGYRNADVGLEDIAVFNDAGDDACNAVDRDGKADVVDLSLGSEAGGGVLGIGNADHFAAAVEERAA